MDNYFETADVNLGAFLLAHKIPYRGAYWSSSDSGRAIFRFKRLTDSEGADVITDLIDNYTFNFTVPVQDFVSAVKFLMGEMKKARRNGGSR
jgi:hypothetical protein